MFRSSKTSVSIGSIVLLCTACPAQRADPAKPAPAAAAVADAKPPVAKPARTSEPVEPRAPVEVGDAPFSHAQPSLEALGRATIDALDTRDENALMMLSVTPTEYKDRLFDALVEHPSAHKLGPDLLWDMHFAESKGELDAAMQHWGGKTLELDRVEVGKVDRRGAIVFHESVTLHVKDADGAAHVLHILGPVVEHVPSGGFKVLSFKHGVDG